MECLVPSLRNPACPARTDAAKLGEVLRSMSLCEQKGYTELVGDQDRRRSRLCQTMTTKKNYRKHTSAFKTRVVLDAIKERETLSELAQRYQLHPTQISIWKMEFIGGAEQVFGDGPVVDAKAYEQEKALLHQQDLSRFAG